MNEFRSHGGLINADLCVAATVVLPGGLWHDVVLPTLFHHAVAPERKHRRVLNDLSRTRFSCVRMSELLPHPFFSLFPNLPVSRRSSLLTREGKGAKSYDLQKAWPSVNCSILSGTNVSLVSKYSSITSASCAITVKWQFNSF